MTDLIVRIIAISFYASATLLFACAMSDEYDDTGKEHSTLGIILSGFKNLALTSAFLSIFSGFIALIFWALETAFGA